jgi:hypothetical protein
MARLQELVREAATDAGLAATGPVADVGLFCLAGADAPSDIRELDAGLRATGLTRQTTVLNDCRAGLRAGSDRGWGVIVICGSGVNASGIAPTAGLLASPRWADLGRLAAEGRWQAACRRSERATVEGRAPLSIASRALRACSPHRGHEGAPRRADR